MIVRTLLFQPFNIPSGSMIPTLLIGDYLFVSKYSYGYSRHSIPFSPPVFEDRIWSSLPERGDVAVFKLPRDGTSDYIKRIIGLPGDTVQMINGVLHINSEPVPREQVGDFRTRDHFGRQVTVPQYRETLPNGVEHITLDIDPSSYADNTTVFTVPADHYFMMGDNRDNSSDSRVASGVGFVPFENFVGRAEVIFFSIDENARFWEFWNWPTSIRWDRMFQSVG
ncbi:MAG: signal peptidase I [Rhizobiales bacterium]|nr:signal peptidase I [Hyphomicrobiales bacterium]